MKCVTVSELVRVGKNKVRRGTVDTVYSERKKEREEEREGQSSKKSKRDFM